MDSYVITENQDVILTESITDTVFFMFNTVKLLILSQSHV